MELVIKGKNLEVTESLRDYAEKKLGRFTRDVDGVMDAQVELSVVRNKSVAENQIAEVTLHINGTVIRGEEATESMYASIDLVTDKISRQIRRYQEKQRNGRHAVKTSVMVAEEAAATERAAAAEEEGVRRIVRQKVHALKPLTPEEAVHQMELLGHNFFVFVNQESSQVNVVYHRKDGNLGLIEPA